MNFIFAFFIDNQSKKPVDKWLQINNITWAITNSTRLAE